jgi:hypothetical protein
MRPVAAISLAPSAAPCRGSTEGGWLLGDTGCCVKSWLLPGAAPVQSITSSGVCLCPPEEGHISGSSSCLGSGQHRPEAPLWRCASRSRAPALQVQSPEFKLQSHQKNPEAPPSKLLVTVGQGGDLGVQNLVFPCYPNWPTTWSPGVSRVCAHLTRALTALAWPPYHLGPLLTLLWSPFPAP